MIQTVTETEDFNANTEYEEMFGSLEKLVGSLQTEASKEGSIPVYAILCGLAGFGVGYGVDFAQTRIYATDAEYDNALRAFLKATGLDKRGFVLGEMATPTERLRVKELFKTYADAVRNSPLSKQLRLFQEFIAQIDDNGYVRPSFQNEIGDGELKNRFDELRTKYKDLPDWFENSEDLTAEQRKEMLAGFDEYVGSKGNPEDLVAMRTYLHDHIDATGRCCGYNFDFEFNAVVDDCGDAVLKQKLEAAKKAGIKLPEECAIKRGEVLTPEKRLKMCSSICDLEAQYSKQAPKPSGYSELVELNKYMKGYIGSDGEYRLRLSSETPFDTNPRISCASNEKNARKVLQENIMAWNTSFEYRQYYPQEELAAMRELNYYMVQTLDEHGTLRKTPGRVYNRGDLPVAVDKKATQKAQQQVRKKLVQPKRPVGGRLLGTFVGVGGGGALDYLLAPKTDYTPELVENDKISGLDGMKISPELIDQMNAYHDLGETGPAVVLGLAQKLLDEGYVAADETLGSALSYIVENKEKGYTFSDYVKTGTAHTKIKETFEKVRLALQEIINKANDQTILECFGVEINLEMTREKLAEDVALKMMDGIFYQILRKAEKHMEEEKQKHDSNDSDGDFFLLQYGERYIDPLEDTVFPSDKYNSRQA